MFHSGYKKMRFFKPTRFMFHKRPTVPVAKWRKELDVDGDLVRLERVPKLFEPFRRNLKEKVAAQNTI